MVLTGGPGTGKTTIVKACIEALAGQTVELCAPTGKAAVRAFEQTGRQAKTVHRLLSWTQEGFVFDRTNQLDVDAIIIDEFSMIDTHLAAALFQAIQSGTRVLIVGDVDQLPSVGPGAVLHDIIMSGAVPTVRLTKIFRQASESAIPHLAAAILQGQVPSVAGAPDIGFITQDDPDVLMDWAVHYLTQALPQLGFDIREVQVLAAQKTRGCGTEPLNRKLQEVLNPPPNGDRECDVYIGGGYACRAGDRVIQTRNNYELGIMNGEQGIVEVSNPQGLDDDFDVPARRKAKPVAIVKFGGVLAGYTAAEVRELQLAYAITVHRAQGSEFKVAVVPVHSCHTWMLTQQLLYTAVTRASQYLLLIGQPWMLQRAAANTREVQRRTRLRTYLDTATAESYS
jgi:exodeoxyribonuclease V alpha subunit